MDKRNKQTNNKPNKPVKRDRVKRTKDEKLAITTLICFALLISFLMVGIQFVAHSSKKVAEAEEDRAEQVALVKAEIEDRETETATREASDKAYRIECVKKQAEEELAKRQAEAEVQAEQVEVNAGNMWKNQQIDYITGNGALSKLQGVNYYNDRRETWYSSRVLYHKDTANWTPDSNGVYRDADGYVVIASSDHAQGSFVDTSHGMGKVYDSGCASGTTDIYVNW